MRTLAFTLVTTLGLGLPGVVNADASGREFGAVFHPAAERVAIETRRRAARVGSEPVGEAVAAAAAAPAAVRRLVGVVRRSDGRQVAWFDGEPVADRSRWHGYVLRVVPGRVVLEAGSGRRLVLHVGDALEVETGRVVDRGARG